MASRHHSRVAVRGPVSIGVGVAVAVAIVPPLGWVAGLLAGWAALAIANVAWLLTALWPMDAARTRTHATTEDPGRVLARTIALTGSVASLGAVVAVLAGSHDTPATARLVAGIAVIAVAASWALIQVDYMLRYAHRFYARREAGVAGGIDFNQDEDPMYSDFGYFSVGLGMTYQVSDTNIEANEIRRIVVAQTLLAYLFGAVILATVINLVAGLG
ncbi:DUF1345 domain-containing protein [Microbacterium dextranolyticum]|uniref:DUF1345 domain-containing protein n=1 Tax=Microbacterium dextranolyticum TaxID=36806 RepID=A0A9W6M5N3_9MICO|nr:DUF1345 domain-containing protein [Microbacterium dextranolyticum]MBM7463316.1 putative membrane protein [Microbacterium dextranolyticum]GLJ95579.1 hypothetical protein GCM10017591_16420 [Microbacterium dextranolyticum]